MFNVTFSWHNLRHQILAVAGIIAYIVILKTYITYGTKAPEPVSLKPVDILQTKGNLQDEHNGGAYDDHGIHNVAQNKTLGFGKILYISLPYRTDRQDQMSLLAATTNLTVTLQPGVIGSTMNPKSRPDAGGGLRDEHWGCWRSHADAWRRVIAENLDTALILEDDADWDEGVHDAFQALSVVMRRGELRREKMSRQEEERAPYGFDWDVLYTGTCWDIRSESEKHVVFDDATAPSRAQMSGDYIGELESYGVMVDDNTHKRILAPSWYPICMVGYAVTQRGAQRLLYNVGRVKDIGAPVDLVVMDKIQKSILKGYTVVPPLIVQYKTGSIKDSDIENYAEKEAELKEGEKLESGSRNLLNSARAKMNEKLGNEMVIDP